MKNNSIPKSVRELRFGRTQEDSVNKGKTSLESLRNNKSS